MRSVAYGKVKPGEVGRVPAQRGNLQGVGTWWSLRPFGAGVAQGPLGPFGALRSGITLRSLRSLCPFRSLGSLGARGFSHRRTDELKSQTDHPSFFLGVALEMETEVVFSRKEIDALEDRGDIDFQQFVLEEHGIQIGNRRREGIVTFPVLGNRKLQIIGDLFVFVADHDHLGACKRHKVVGQREAEAGLSILGDGPGADLIIGILACALVCAIACGRYPDLLRHQRRQGSGDEQRTGKDQKGLNSERSIDHNYTSLPLFLYSSLRSKDKAKRIR